MITPVLLCGGSGTRLWPLSREMYPKQLLSLAGNSSLLQQTVQRLSGIEEIGPPLVICNEEHRFLVAEQLRQINVAPEAILLEPVGRNTAPAAALAALRLREEAEDRVLLVLPADHLIQDVEAFQQAVSRGRDIAQNGRLVTFGIVPTGPETGYGYIKKGKEVRDQDRATGAYLIDCFVEKPDLKTANQYVEDGSYFWNSGMFMYTAALFVEELQNQNKEMVSCCMQSLQKAKSDLDFIRLDKESFSACPNDSIDYAVMEKTDKGAVIPVDVGWSDIGSWSSLWEVGEKDEDGNVTQGDVIHQATHNSFLYSGSRLLTTVGIEDCVVVETNDAVLVAKKDKVQDVKKIVTLLRQQGRAEANLHSKVYRPWGSYEGVVTGNRFQVKLITVKPGAVLSLQMHHHRAEHWVVVKGTAKITKGDSEFVLSENESTFIPLGVTHRLENPGVIPLELIEVQSGSYLGEDDIVRFDDNYGRAD